MKKLSTLLIIVTILISCNNGKKETILTDTPTSGTINIMVDECYQPILDSEKMVFEAQYPDAHINIIYGPSEDVMNSFSNDSIRMLVTAFPFDSSYLKSYDKAHKYYPSVTILAKDAVAIIANNEREGLKMSQEEFKKVCNGEITDFSQLKYGKKAGKINLVFDNEKSSTVAYIRDSILRGDKMTANAYAQKTNPEVINYVKSNKDALGVIGVNWISDAQDEETIEFSKFIFPVEMGSNDENIYFYKPYPAYVAMHKYPYRRFMYATLKEGGAALGRGFVNFMSGDIGQTIVLKSGLAPAVAQTRVVEAKKSM